MKKILIPLIGVFVLCIALFTLSSKGEEPWEPPVACETLVSKDGVISIQFNPAPNPFRNPGFEYYVPDSDLRNADYYNFNPGLTQFDNAWFCLVTITSASCPNWTWQRALARENCVNINARTMAIKLPPSTHDAIVKIEYWEISDYRLQNFNKVADGITNSRVKWQFQQTFQGWGSPIIPQPCYLNPVANEPDYTMNYFNPDGSPIGPLFGGKTSSQLDFSLNDWIDLSGIHP